jgi:ubiquitin-conjugating enzyme E2 variant
MLNLLNATLLNVLFAAGCIIAADFLSGLLHWAEDTWLVPGKNAWLDRYIVAPNIEHHEKPGGIRACTYWELNCVCIAIAASVALVVALAGVREWEVYLTLLIASQSNQIHAWGHTANPPRFVAWLQRARILQTAAHHAVHHKRPYGVRYCTTTPWLNGMLDRSGFWRGLESTIAHFGPSVKRATAARSGY